MGSMKAVVLEARSLFDEGHKSGNVVIALAGEDV
jgi:hypothetical protein